MPDQLRTTEEPVQRPLVEAASSNENNNTAKTPGKVKAMRISIQGFFENSIRLDENNNAVRVPERWRALELPIKQILEGATTSEEKMMRLRPWATVSVYGLMAWLEVELDIDNEKEAEKEQLKGRASAEKSHYHPGHVEIKQRPHKPPHPEYIEGITTLGKTRYGIPVMLEQFQDNKFLHNGLDAEDLTGEKWWHETHRKEAARLKALVLKAACLGNGQCLTSSEEDDLANWEACTCHAARRSASTLEMSEYGHWLSESSEVEKYSSGTGLTPLSPFPIHLESPELVFKPIAVCTHAIRDSFEVATASSMSNTTVDEGWPLDDDLGWEAAKLRQRALLEKENFDLEEGTIVSEHIVSTTPKVGYQLPPIPFRSEDYRKIVTVNGKQGMIGKSHRILGALQAMQSKIKHTVVGRSGNIPKSATAVEIYERDIFDFVEYIGHGAIVSQALERKKEEVQVSGGPGPGKKIPRLRRVGRISFDKVKIENLSSSY
ncbi:hypothetical protein BGZ60DRAFT_567571 [Tricladium varicosporioides]|nr:hypothetical protein BGZ60DRAFT_567571 [Hymenoscyphus varicosporioides]